MIEWGRTTGGVTTITRDGTPAATARKAAMRGDMYVEIDGARWLFFASRGALVGERSGAEQPSLRATRPGRNRHAWDVQADRAMYRVERRSRVQNRFVVRQESTEVATGFGARRFKRARLDINTGMSLEHQVFLLWLIGGDHRPAKRARGGSAADGPIPGSTAFGGFGAGGADVGPT